MTIKVKICGLTDKKTVEIAVNAGADFLGVVFFDKSPRYITTIDANEILQSVPKKIKKVGLFVDPKDALLDDAMNNVNLDFFQLHGTESPERVEQVRLKFGMSVIKTISVSEISDLDCVSSYADVADWLLFDAKPSVGATCPGGNSLPIDWNILKKRTWFCPWFLAGGLTIDNVNEAIRLSETRAVDISSGVESNIGIKDFDKIIKFISVVRDNPDF
ncbi:MAG: phosphoribosylanthranilate isomerase [Rhodospirillaceae bacterium]|nr:phosphoribosylanthranilate isomerase [Rhodospirillaceae bacterium]